MKRMHVKSVYIWFWLNLLLCFGKWENLHDYDMSVLQIYGVCIWEVKDTWKNECACVSSFDILNWGFNGKIYRNHSTKAEGKEDMVKTEINIALHWYRIQHKYCWVIQSLFIHKGLTTVKNHPMILWLKDFKVEAFPTDTK